MHCSVNSGIPKETIVWKYNNTIMVIGGPAFFIAYVHPYKKKSFEKLDVQRQQQ
jgi:hypothetical protein